MTAAIIRFTCRLLVLAVALIPASASAGIMGTSGAVEIVLPPGDVQFGQFESNAFVRAFVERQALLLARDVAVDITSPGTSPQPPQVNLSPGVVQAGTLVDSYYLHFDPVGTPVEVRRTGSITFDGEILGLIIGVKDGVNVFDAGNTLGVSNADLGFPGTLYGFEPVDLYNFTDSLTLSADRRTVSFDWGTGPSADNLRIITTATVPEPSCLVLIGTGASLLMIGRQVRRRMRF